MHYFIGCYKTVIFRFFYSFFVNQMDYYTSKKKYPLIYYLESNVTKMKIEYSGFGNNPPSKDN